MAELHETPMGRRFFEGDVPGIRKALERIADAIESDAKPIVEMVWVVTDVVEKTHLAYASAQGCRLALVGELKDRKLTHLWGKKLEQWDGLSPLDLAMFHVQPMDVTL